MRWREACFKRQKLIHNNIIMAKYDDYDWDELPTEVKAAGKFTCYIFQRSVDCAHQASGASSNVFCLVSPLNYICATAAALGFNKQLWDNDDEPDACDE